MNQPSRSAAPGSNGTDRLLLPTAVTVVALFTTAWVVLGVRSDGYTLFGTVIDEYSAVTQPISGLGLGATAAAMNTSFVAYGLLAAVGALPISRRLDRIAPGTQPVAAATLVAHGVGAALCGLFTLEAMTMHSLGFLLVLAPLAGFPLIGRRLHEHPALRRPARLLLWVATPLGLALVVLFLAGFDPAAAGQGQGMAGLTQRALILNIQVGLCVLAWTAARPPAPA